eukprot:m.42698 g.42698  ORF g.42698 m.42698 type:complete len:245 (+) comp11569_c0_seq2:103-837(+)
MASAGTQRLLPAALVLLGFFLFLMLVSSAFRVAVVTWLLSAERLSDGVIGYCLDALGRIWRAWKLVIVVVVFPAVSYLLWEPVVVRRVVVPVKAALDDGINERNFAACVAIGIVAGLSAPGVTMPIQTLMFVAGARMGFGFAAHEFAVASAINLSLTVVDILVWTDVFVPLGSMFVPAGGRYVRPFLSGILPFAIVAAPAVAGLYHLSLHAIRACMPARLIKGKNKGAAAGNSSSSTPSSLLPS